MESSAREEVGEVDEIVLKCLPFVRKEHWPKSPCLCAQQQYTSTAHVEFSLSFASVLCICTFLFIQISLLNHILFKSHFPSLYNNVHKKLKESVFMLEKLETFGEDVHQFLQYLRKQWNLQIMDLGIVIFAMWKNIILAVSLFFFFWLKSEIWPFA